MVEFIASVHRTILGVLISFLGILSFGVVIRAIPDGRYVIGLLAGLFSAVAAVAVLLLFIEGIQSS